MEAAVSFRRQTSGRGADQYQKNAILNASPEELILKLYDLIIVSIKKEDYRKANLALSELISSLNFDYKEVSLGFFRLYRYCQDCLYKQKPEEPLRIIRELRDSWAQAFSLL